MTALLSLHGPFDLHTTSIQCGASLFSRLGWIWVCRGDLSIGRISSQDRRQLDRQLQELKAPPPDR